MKHGWYVRKLCAACQCGVYASDLTDDGVCRDWRGCQERQGQAALRRLDERAATPARRGARVGED